MKRGHIFALVILMFVILNIASVLYADPDILSWERGAYWDGRYPSTWAGGGEAVRDVLEYVGYKILDADELKAWMDARITDGKSSVVVFCKDVAPDTILESMSSNCTLRRYLNAGGKIVWYADIPAYYQGHTDGTLTNYGPDGSINVLGFNAASGSWDSEDEVAFTLNGSAWGLTETWRSVRPTSASGIRVLARDTSGAAAAWVKHYVAGDDYRGFVRLYDQAGEPNVNDLRRAAEYPNVPEPIVYPKMGLYVDGNLIFEWEVQGSVPDLGIESNDQDYSGAVFVQKGIHKVELEMTDDVGGRNLLVDYVDVNALFTEEPSVEGAETGSSP